MPHPCGLLLYAVNTNTKRRSAVLTAIDRSCYLRVLLSIASHWRGNYRALYVYPCLMKIYDYENWILWNSEP